MTSFKKNFPEFVVRKLSIQFIPPVIFHYKSKAAYFLIFQLSNQNEIDSPTKLFEYLKGIVLQEILAHIPSFLSLIDAYYLLHSLKTIANFNLSYYYSLL